MSVLPGPADAHVRTGRRRIPKGERVYARAMALAVQALDIDAGARELAALAGGDPHVLGNVRDRVAVLTAERPRSRYAERALALLTAAWLSAIGTA